MKKYFFLVETSSYTWVLDKNQHANHRNDRAIKKKFYSKI